MVWEVRNTPEASGLDVAIDLKECAAAWKCWRAGDTSQSGSVNPGLPCREVRLAVKCGAGIGWRPGDQLGWVLCPSHLAAAAAWRGAG